VEHGRRFVGLARPDFVGRRCKGTPPQTLAGETPPFRRLRPPPSGPSGESGLGMLRVPIDQVKLPVVS